MKFLPILLLLCVPAQAETFRFTGDNDKWIAPDKWGHLVGGIGTTLILRAHFKDTKKAALYSLALWTAFEIKDGFFPKEKYGKWGACGASYKDLIWSFAGIAVTAGIIKILKL